MRRLAPILAVVGLLAFGDSAQEKTPPKPGGIYVHVWALRVMYGKGVNTGNYEMVHHSEGPFSKDKALARRREIATVGFESGDAFYPLHRVQLVELKPDP